MSEEIDPAFEKVAKSLMVTLRDLLTSAPRASLQKLLRPADRGMYGFLMPLKGTRKLVSQLSDLPKERATEILLTNLKFANVAALKGRNLPLSRPEVWANIQKYNPKYSIVVYWEIDHDETEDYYLAQQILDLKKQVTIEEMKTLTEGPLKEFETEIKRTLSEEEKTAVLTDLKVTIDDSKEPVEAGEVVKIFQTRLKELFQECNGCHLRKLNARKCVCQKVRYCGKDCQKKDWAKHKGDCKQKAKK